MHYSCSESLIHQTTQLQHYDKHLTDFSSKLEGKLISNVMNLFTSIHLFHLAHCKKVIINRFCSCTLGSYSLVSLYFFANSSAMPVYCH